MHLTNYAINKFSEGFKPNININNMGVGSKRHIDWFYEYLDKHDFDSKKVKSDIKSTIVKTIISGLPHIVH